MQNCKKNCGVEFLQLRNFNLFFFNLEKFTSTEFVIIFPVSSLMGNEKILRKYVGSQFFKNDAVIGKRFVAMQQNSATLIYDLNARKGTLESYLKKLHSHLKQ